MERSLYWYIGSLRILTNIYTTALTTINLFIAFLAMAVFFLGMFWMSMAKKFKIFSDGLMSKVNALCEGRKRDLLLHNLKILASLKLSMQPLFSRYWKNIIIRKVEITYRIRSCFANRGLLFNFFYVLFENRIVVNYQKG